ncbi:hypothetical protein JCM10908_005395 [Rhodotorula pacifica]|uniref:uncharacterized protein n=1 Tax=Rhodotorula pacifica TaxID=1495444 RepID=UPI0031716916
MDSDIWDDDGWEDMPVIRSADLEAPVSLFDAEVRSERDSKNRLRLTAPAPTRLADVPGATQGHATIAGGAATGNATGRLVETTEQGGGGATSGLREKEDLDEMDYTRLELDDDPEEDEISMRTQYLFNEDTSMTPLSQMQQTKTLLTEGQRIAYVGLCRLVTREMVQTLALAAKGAKELEPARESCQHWANKIMGRLYRHMDVDSAEQRMIEQLAEHGVTSDDLVPSLVATYTMDNPEYDPEAAEEAAQEADIAAPAFTNGDPTSAGETSTSQGLPDDPWRTSTTSSLPSLPSASPTTKRRRIPSPPPLARASSGQASLQERLGDLALGSDQDDGVDNEDDEQPVGYVRSEVRKIERKTSQVALDSPPLASPRTPRRARTRMSVDTDMEDSFGGGDIGAALDDVSTPTISARPLPSSGGSSTDERASFEQPTSPIDRSASASPSPPTPKAPALPPPAYDVQDPVKEASEEDKSTAILPSTLPGVTKNPTNLDRTVTLDIRWTVLCDLFLALIADSVYDARSRVLLGNCAEKLGLEWMDVVRFERRLTEALEIQEAVKQKEHGEVLEGRRLKDRQKRYLMMGLATVGGGLVIGLSAGLLAPVIGAGLGTALATIGVGGTSTFLGGAGGVALISTGATLSGATIGGKAMARRTRDVKTFDVQPLHNNKRVNFFITVPGFMAGPRDDVRLPFSTIDPVVGDVLSILWEPEMMGDTGNALKILTSEVLSSAGQQVLAATLMATLMSALQWPIMLTKLSYLIDNPWSNALDRARQAGAVLADILLNRRLGVRPVSLIGYSLGARVVFFALLELAKQNAFGVVQEVYLFGATVTASIKVWRQVRGVVAGRFVNGFAMNDWILGYLFRATTGGLQTVAGLRPIEHVPDLENVNVTHLLEGHMSYRTKMPKLLAYVGFKTTADHFDEPDFDPDAPEREVLTEEEIERRRLEKEKRERSAMNIFRRKRKGTEAQSQPLSRTQSTEEYDLPPRLSTSSDPSQAGKGTSAGGAFGSRNASSLSISSTVASDADVSTSAADSHSKASPSRPQVAETVKADPTPPREAPVPSGFNLDKLREEVAQLPRPAPPERASTVPPREASESAPTPLAQQEPERPPSAPIPLGPPPTDLRELDQSLDPRELLRRQWLGEMSNAAGGEQASLPPPPAASAWDSDANLPDDQFATGFAFSSSSSSALPDAPTFSFGNGKDFSSPAPASRADAPAPTAVWGNGGSSSLASDNPW